MHFQNRLKRYNADIATIVERRYGTNETSKCFARNSMSAKDVDERTNSFASHALYFLSFFQRNGEPTFRHDQVKSAIKLSSYGSFDFSRWLRLCVRFQIPI